MTQGRSKRQEWPGRAGQVQNERPEQAGQAGFPPRSLLPVGLHAGLVPSPGKGYVESGESKEEGVGGPSRFP